MGSELVLAVFSTFFWALAPEGGAKNVLFVLASTTWIMTLAINLSPFMRFDGYFVLSDLLDFPNLHERSFACARWWMRKTFFGLDEPMPEPDLRPRQRAGLIVFAWLTWFYRLTVFLGIALLVYHIAFKLLGIFLMFVELIWFIARPVWQEARVRLEERASAVTMAWRPAIVVLALITAFVWIIPVSYEVTAPAIAARAGRARGLRAVRRQGDCGARGGPPVGRRRDRAGALQALDLEVREKKADISIASARAELARMPASLRLQESFGVLQERLAQALAEKQAVQRRSRPPAAARRPGGHRARRGAGPGAPVAGSARASC